MESIACLSPSSVSKALKGFALQNSKLHFHYQEPSDAIDNKEEFFEPTNNKTTKRVYDHTVVCGKLLSNDQRDRIVTKEILEENINGLGLTKLKKTVHQTLVKQLPIKVTFQVLGFEISHADQHTSIVDIVLLNGRQYTTICCEKYERRLVLSDKEILQQENLNPCKPKLLQYLSHFENTSCVTENGKFRPSFNLIKTILKQVKKPLSLHQMEAIIYLCQQIPCNKDTYEQLRNELAEWKSEIADSLFSAMEGEKWQKTDSLIDTFLGWAFFPLQQVLKPMLDLSLDLLQDSPHLYRHVISAKFGNQLSQAKLIEMGDMMDSEEAAQWNFYFPVTTKGKTIGKYPDILLFAHNYEWLETTEIIEDVRCWGHVFPEYAKNCPTEKERYNSLLFSEEWRMSCIFNKLMGTEKEDEIETLEKLLEQLNKGLYLHFKMVSAKTIPEKLKLCKESILHGIVEDFYIIRKFEKEEKELWREQVWMDN